MCHFFLTGKRLIIDKALYGLKSSSARFHEHLSVKLRKLEFIPSKADPDLWIKKLQDGTYEYKSTPYFLAPSQVSNYSSKFALILSLIEKSDGIIFVYSSLKELGCKLFSMCLEEHGYSNAMGKTLMKKTSEEIPKGSKGKYILLTPELTELDQKKAIDMLIRKENSNGQQVKILVGSKFIAEGIDLKNIRQIHDTFKCEE